MHLMKLCVGVVSPEALRQAIAARPDPAAPVRHLTRHTPREATRILAAGGSLYWVIGGALQVRQALLDIVPVTSADGGRRCELRLAPTLTAVEARATRPFQGWRYLRPEAAPPDLDGGAGQADGLPPELRRALRELCLL